MSVVLPIEEDQRFRVYVSSAGQTAFAIPFPFQQDLDISVAVEETPGIWAFLDRTLFAMTGAGSPEGGVATFLAGRTDGERILILGDAVLERLGSVVKDGRFASRLTDDEFDRNRIIQQEQQRDTGRSVKVPYGQQAQDLPVPEAGKLLGWIGDRLSNIPNVDQSITAALAAAVAALAAVNAGYVFDNETDFAAASVPAILDFVDVAGDAAPGDGGAKRYWKLPAMPSPVEQWHRNVDGKWFELGEPNGKTISIKAFGARLSAGQTPTQRRLKIQAAIDWAAPRGYTVHIPAGVWFTDDALKWRFGTVIDGAGMDHTILRFSNTAHENNNMMQPAATDMSIGRVMVSNLTLDGNRDARVAAGTVTGVGTIRPGASGLATMSAHDCTFYRVRSIGHVLHCFDDCAGGDLNGSGVLSYCYPEGKTIYSTTPGLRNAFIECEAKDWADDGFTTHYVRNTLIVRCRSEDGSSYYNGLVGSDADGNLNGSCCYEFDDGTLGAAIIDSYAKGSARGIIAKNHVNRPCASMVDIIGNLVEGCGVGITVAGYDATNRGFDYKIINNTVRNPVQLPDRTIDMHGIRIASVDGVLCVGNHIKAPPGVAGLGSGIYLNPSSTKVVINDYLIENWPGDLNTTDPQIAAIRIAGGSDTQVGQGRIINPGLRGIAWTGSVVGSRQVGPVDIVGSNLANSVGIETSVYPAEANFLCNVSGFPTLMLLGGQAFTDKAVNYFSGHVQTNGHFNAGDTTVRTYHTLRHALTDVAGDQVLGVAQYDGAQSLNVYARGTGTVGYNGANACVKVPVMQTTGRSINAGGTINASGADYAEYHQVIEPLWGSVAAGAILGFDAAGLLTDRYADVVGHFVVKSTNPFGVGGDDWGSEARICAAQGCLPLGPEPQARDVDEPADDADDDAWSAYAAERAAAQAELLVAVAARDSRKIALAVAYEAERVKRDRIAKTGYVPVNIAATSADVGKYLVPIDDGSGGITADLMDMAAAEDAATTIAALRAVQKAYRRSIGVVIGLAEDGRPLVEVKVG